MKVRCNVCREYVERESAIRFGVVSFCSDECVQAYRFKTTKKKSKKPDVSEDLRNEVLEADGHCCRFCGRSSGYLHVHHIVYRSQGGPHEVGNLISLCPEHHDRVHSNKKLYQPLAQQVVDLRLSKGDKITTIAYLQAQQSRSIDG